MKIVKLYPRWIFIILCFFLCIGCTGSKSAKDVYIYVFNEEHSAPTNNEWYKQQEKIQMEPTVEVYFKKGSWIHLRNQAEGDTITIMVGADKIDLATSAITLLSPEQFKQTQNVTSDSPEEIKRLSKYLDTHNVLLLSDGTVPPQTAKSTAMDFWYACIPALLLLCIMQLCKKIDSVILPAIGLVIMLSQFIILFWLILPGVAIDAIELFIFPALLFGFLVASVNLLAGMSMCESIIRYSNFAVTWKLILLSIVIGVVSIVVSMALYKYVPGITPEWEYYKLGTVLCYVLGIAIGLLCFLFILIKQQPTKVLPAILLVTIFLVMVIIGGLVAFLLLIYFVWRACTALFNGAGGALLAGGTGNGSSSSTNACCMNCKYYNNYNQQCSSFHQRISNPNKERGCCVWK